ncbi:MAG: SAM-dependent chlorinase/fluorinase, partial [Myxococcota bacterium]
MDARPFAPSGVVSLTTDFGTTGPYVGALHGVILSRHPAARIVDLTHDVEVHWPAEAGFWLERTYRHFPPGTVHVAVVESGMRVVRAGVLVRLDDHVFVGPDNGLLAPLAERPEAKVHAIENQALRGLGLERASATFRGRDVQAPLGGAIAAGQIAPEAVGPEVEDWVPILLEPARLSGGEVQGVVITVDGFGTQSSTSGPTASGAIWPAAIAPPRGA